MEPNADLALQPDPGRYTLPAFIEDVCTRHADHEALRFEGKSWTYTELADEVRRVALGLTGLGVVKGTRVGVLFANRPEWLFAFFGAAQVGAVLVPINTFATGDELDFVLRHGDVSVLLAQSALLRHRYVDDLLERHDALRDSEPGAIRCLELPQLRRVLAFGLEEPCGAVELWSRIEVAGQGVDDALLTAAASEIDPADDGLVIYTSGTTAQPKGVVHRQRAPVIQSWRFAEAMALTPEDRVWTAQPFFWSAGICMSLGATLAAGATLVLQEHFEPGAALELIEAERATALHCWPHQGQAMGEHPEAADRDLSAVTKVEFKSALGRLVGLSKDQWGIYCSYGLSETFTMASALPSWASPAMRVASSGQALAGTELRIVDPETGAELSQGEKGEIAVRGLTLMRGYAKVAPELVFDAEGWFLTQDGGYIDEDGLLHWSGRLSNLIKTGGANVSPLEIEAALGVYPGLTAGLAVGVPHPSLGEAIVLCAVRAPGADPVDADALLRALREKLAAYKVPRCVLFFDESEIATTGTQKIQVGALRDLAVARLGEDGVELAGPAYG